MVEESREVRAEHRCRLQDGRSGYRVPPSVSSRTSSLSISPYLKQSDGGFMTGTRETK